MPSIAVRDNSATFCSIHKEAGKLDLTGRVALVTGGSGDLGSAICRALARQRMDIAVTYLGEKERAERTVSEVESAGCRAWAVHLDQSSATMPDEVVTSTTAHFGRLDVLVNNAAWNIGIPFTDLETLTADVWDRMYATNLRGPYLLARAAARTMRIQGEGRIVNIASVGGLYPAASSIAYSSTKAGLIHLTRCLAVALAPNVLVNCVAPGLVEGTRMAQRIPPPLVEAVLGRALLHKGASADDIADQVVTFCRTETTTGQVLPIDSGFVFN
jgi:3-oxoacyl-[acyl-carrier protein] reductase